MMMHDEQGFKDTFMEYLESNDWWIIFPRSRMEALAHIEKAHYLGEANGDFHIMMGPHIPGFTIAFAHKKHMSPQQILDLGISRASLEDLEQRDVLWLASEDELEEETYAEAVSFNRWLTS